MKFPRRAFFGLMAWSALAFTPTFGIAGQDAASGDLRSPRSVLDVFLAEQREDEPDWERVTHTLAVPAGVELEDGARTASRLKSVLDARGLFVVMGQIPSAPDYRDPETDAPRFAPFPLRFPEFVLERGSDQGWRIASETVMATDDLYEGTFSWLARRLLEILPPAFERSWFGFTLWGVLGLFVLAGGAWLIRFLLLLLARGFAPVASHRARWLGDGVLELAGPAAAVAGVAFARHFLPDLRFPVEVSRALVFLLTVALAFIAVWAALRAVDVATLALKRLADHTETTLDDQLIAPARTVLRVAAVLIAVLVLAESFGYSITTLVAGLGLGGLAVALAAQDTLANLLGWAAVVVDQPFKVGDWVLVGNSEGTVERVGLRATRIRTFYDSVISVPNRTVANAVVDNMGQRKYRRMKQIVRLRQDTHPDRVHAFVEGMRKIVLANKRMRQDAFEIHLNQFSESSMDVLVYCFFEVKDWHEELTERHNFILETMRLAQALDVRFAVPVRDLHLESAPDHPRGEVPEPDIPRLKETVEAFGPGGRLSRPGGPA